MSGLVAAALSAAILGSAFLPWIDIRVIVEISLWDFVRDNIERIVDALRGGDVPWGAWVFVASFPAAALSVLASLGGLSRPVALVAGALPLVAAGWAVLSARDRVIEFFGRVPGETGQLLEITGLGVWVYIGAAALLTLVALFAPSGRG